MRRKIVYISALVSIILVGCSSTLSYDEDNNSIVPRGKAFYVDSAVEGVVAVCRSTVTTTNIDGEFSYEVGDGCKFWIGDILLREEGGVTLGERILEDVIEVAQFLQSLDNDNIVANGITITPKTTLTLIEHNITKVPQSEDELIDIITMLQESNIDFGGEFVDRDTAQKHIDYTEKLIKNTKYFEE
jgi:hypothetical protein